MMQFYLGTKQIQARMVTAVEASNLIGRPHPDSIASDQEGYLVVYPDGYQSWSPKETFESAYLPMGEGSDGTHINEAMVDAFTVSYDFAKMGSKTTACVATLRNGYEITVSSSCVDPDNYDQALGELQCKLRVRDKVWEYLGFLLQSARAASSPRTAAARR